MMCSITRWSCSWRYFSLTLETCKRMVDRLYPAIWYPRISKENARTMTENVCGACERATLGLSYSVSLNGSWGNERSDETISSVAQWDHDGQFGVAWPLTACRNRTAKLTWRVQVMWGQVMFNLCFCVVIPRKSLFEAHCTWSLEARSW